MVTKNK